MPPRKSKRVTRKTVRKDVRKTSRKAVRKTSRKAVRKTSRKAVRKTLRKAVRKTSRKAARKTSRKVSKTIVKNTQNNQSKNIDNKLLKEMKASGDAMNVLGNSKHKLFFIDKKFYLIGTIKKIINLCANVLREKHFNRKSLADKITDPEFDKYKVSPSKINSKHSFKNYFI